MFPNTFLEDGELTSAIHEKYLAGEKIAKS